MMRKSLLTDEWLMIRTVETELRVQALMRLKAPLTITQSDRKILQDRYEEIKNRGLNKKDFKEIVLEYMKRKVEEELEEMTEVDCSGCDKVDHNAEGDSYICKEGHKDTVNPGLCFDFNPVDEGTEDMVLVNRNLSLLEMKDKIKEIEQW